MPIRRCTQSLEQWLGISGIITQISHDERFAIISAVNHRERVSTRASIEALLQLLEFLDADQFWRERTWPADHAQSIGPLVCPTSWATRYSSPYVMPEKVPSIARFSQKFVSRVWYRVLGVPKVLSFRSGLTCVPAGTPRYSRLNHLHQVGVRSFQDVLGNQVRLDIYSRLYSRP